MSPLTPAKVAIALALALCALAATEMAWRIYGLGLAIEGELRFPPISAEAMSTKAAPLLRAASNAEPIYTIVQTQHVDLQQKHEFVVAVVESACVTASIGLACTSLAFVLLSFAYHRVSRLAAFQAPGSSREENAA
jgi:hypothetical protein